MSWSNIDLSCVMFVLFPVLVIPVVLLCCVVLAVLAVLAVAVIDCPHGCYVTVILGAGGGIAGQETKKSLDNIILKDEIHRETTAQPYDAIYEPKDQETKKTRAAFRSLNPSFPWFGVCMCHLQTICSNCQFSLVVILKSRFKV